MHCYKSIKFIDMKKITLFIVAAFFAAFNASSQTLNNPKDADGFYIVKWDCNTDTWAASNNVEVDETFVMAVDVTGTPLENWLAEAPTAAGATRSLALNKWSGDGGLNGDSHRFKRIRGNIYGATWNILQLGVPDFAVATATTIGAQTYVFGQLFGFEFTSDNPGAGWWMWPSGIPEGTNINPGTESGAIFRTSAYTGTKTSPEFYNDDYPGLFESAYGTVKGYAPSCAVTTDVFTPIVNVSPVIGHEYYNLQGGRLSEEPMNGLFIDKAIREDGSSFTTKILKSIK